MRDSGGGTIKVIKANTKIAQTQISTIKYKFEKLMAMLSLGYKQQVQKKEAPPILREINIETKSK